MIRRTLCFSFSRPLENMPPWARVRCGLNHSDGRVRRHSVTYSSGSPVRSHWADREVSSIGYGPGLLLVVPRGVNDRTDVEQSDGEDERREDQQVLRPLSRTQREQEVTDQGRLTRSGGGCS